MKIDGDSAPGGRHEDDHRGVHEIYTTMYK